MLSHPSSAANLALHVDASDKCIGAVLHQSTSEGLRPLGFFSKRLSKEKQRYSTYDRELEAIFRGVRHFKDQVEERNLTIFTDHKPLTFAMTKSESTTKQRQVRQLDFISQYTTDIQYVKGDNNTVADCMSRIASFAPEVVDSATVSKTQETDEELQQLLKGEKRSSLMLDTAKNAFGIKLTCDTSTGKRRPFIPKSLRQRIIGQLHNLAHPGRKATQKMVAENFVWPDLNRDCNTYVQHCIPCQQTKVNKHTLTPLVTPTPPNGRFRHFNIDLIGPYDVCRGYRYALTIIDRYTRWPTAIPIIDASAKSVARALLEGYIQQYGVPTKIVSDQGPCFIATLFKDLSQLLGTAINMPHEE